MTAFDAYLMVDWSAAASPKRGRDSIWLGLTRPGTRLRLANPATRHDAVATLTHWLTGTLGSARVLVGWDFPFGYPAGTARALGGSTWRTLWDALAQAVDDRDDNANNRYTVARDLNRRLTGEAFPFWGHSGRDEDRFLRRRGRRPHGLGDLAERRLIERRVKRAQPVWKLAGAGAVGSQALLGIPRVDALRHHPALAAHSAIWPFETGLQAPTARVVHAEVYPSLVVPRTLAGRPRDAGQVAAIGRHFASLDAACQLVPCFALDSLTPAERRIVAREEAWILGVH